MIPEWKYELAASLEEAASRFGEEFRGHGFGLFCQLDNSHSLHPTLILRLVYPRSEGASLLGQGQGLRSKAFTAVLQEISFHRVSVSLRAPTGAEGRLLAEALSPTIDDAFSRLSSVVAS